MKGQSRKRDGGKSCCNAMENEPKDLDTKLDEVIYKVTGKYYQISTAQDFQHICNASSPEVNGRHIS